MSASGYWDCAVVWTISALEMKGSLSERIAQKDAIIRLLVEFTAKIRGIDLHRSRCLQSREG